MNERIIITVDGLAGSGKTTLSRLLAERLGFQHLNSGILYRAVGYLALQENISSEDEVALKSMLSRFHISLDVDSAGAPCISIDGRVYGEEFQTPRVSESTSKCANKPVVRDFLRDAQREAFPGKNLVAEGRDMGTVIFPDAPVKFFVEVDVAQRVQRRIEQLLESASDVDLKHRNNLEKQMEIEISQRDERDVTRIIAPTIPAPDAIIINNSVQTLTQVVQSMYDFVASKGVV